MVIGATIATYFLRTIRPAVILFDAANYTTRTPPRFRSCHLVR